MNRILKKLNTAQVKYQDIIDSVEGELKNKIEFEFSVFYQSSDGWVILGIEGARNAPFEDCLLVIKEKGCLSLKDYLNITI